MARAWYAYSGTGSPGHPNNFYYISYKPLSRTGAEICSIYAVYAGTHPLEISENLQTYIANGLATYLPQPQTPIGAKKYLYMKNVT